MPKCLSLTHAHASHGFHVHRILSPPSSTWQFDTAVDEIDSRWISTSGCPCLCGCLCKICLPAISRNMSLHENNHKKYHKSSTDSWTLPWKTTKKDQKSISQNISKFQLLLGFSLPVITTRMFKVGDPNLKLHNETPLVCQRPCQRR